MRIHAFLLCGAWAVFLPAQAGDAALNPAVFPRLGSIDPRFQSYNVEMIEVTGGAFWKPYGAEDEAPQGPTPPGMDPKIYAYRAPKDFTNPRLRRLAAALAPAYIRVSGTWANTTYFADSDTPPKEPPPGFNGVLTRAQWKGVVDFSKAVDARIITSVAVGPGTRDAKGLWTATVAKPWFAYTKAIGGEIAAAEFANEPNLARLAGFPAGYDAAAYGRDFAAFRAFAREADPKLLVLGTGAVGTPSPAGTPPQKDMLPLEDLLKASGAVDVESYHHYGDVSARCHGARTAAAALDEEWLGRTAKTAAYHLAARDRYAPGKPVWLTEVGDAACGGNPWATTFLDSFRYLDQLGRLAKMGVSVVAHNTLAISDYGLLDEKDYTPRPNYWAALVWRRLMGPTVLEAGVPAREGLHVYAQCTYDKRGAVTLLVINNSRSAETSLAISRNAQRYTLSADRPDSHEVKLNGMPLALGPKDALPVIAGVPVKAGTQTFAPVTITFLVMPGTANPAC